MTLHNYQVLFASFAIYLLYIPNVSSTHEHDPLFMMNSDKFTTYHPGQNYKGLSNVKNYFHQLGYIPKVSPFNFDDHFDDNLVSAIKTYQKNYNLNPTGKLDRNTVRQLKTPRCGVPDIIKTNTKTSVDSDKLHSLYTVSHYTHSFKNPWPKGNLSYTFQGNVNDTFKSAVIRGMNRWSQVVDVKFQEGASPQNSKLKIAFLRGNHGDRKPFDGPGGTLAHAGAIPPRIGVCHFDADEYFVASGDVTKSTVAKACDLESVATHEMGHVLGLGHSLNKSAVMYAYLNTRTRKVDLTDDDKQGILDLYK